jgi:3-phenylpropionate/trans-cinnamate dioxygenase ferredoxin reductase subunit
VIVIVGAGLAGLHTVVALRGQGYAGPVTLLGAEGLAPYDRPPLTKELLRGDTDDTTLEADWAALDVDLRLSTRALVVEPGVVRTDDGPIGFDSLVLATGAEPRRLPGDAMTLRTRGDALELREVLRPGARLVVVGAGWIGAEVSTAALAAGAQVTVLEGAGVPHAGALPAEIGARMTPWWSGVDLRFGALVDRAEAHAVHLVGGEVVQGDAVLVGIGVRPVAVPGVELTPAGAVAVDAGLRSSVPGVLAVGDCAAWQSGRWGVRLNVEHWDNALHAPAVAAANALGGDETWDPVPYFWSEQWGRMVQYAGHHPAGERIVWREDGERWAAFWLAGDRLAAALTVDRPRDLVQARRLMQQGAAVDADVLADPGAAVKSAAT